MNPSGIKIRIYGDSCLREKSVPVKDVGASERILIKVMLETMREANGIGLAAPQVGINQQIFVADIGEGPLAVFNPKILKRKGADFMEEGCLSCPGSVVNVKRAKTIVVRYCDENNKTVERTFSDLMARVFLHETDHLMGKLILDYAGRRQQAAYHQQAQENAGPSQSINL